MTPSTRSGRPRAARSSDVLRASSRRNTSHTAARPTTHHSAASVTSSATSTPTPRPAHRDAPSWEELFGRR